MNRAPAVTDGSAITSSCGGELPSITVREKEVLAENGGLALLVARTVKVRD